MVCNLDRAYLKDAQLRVCITVCASNDTKFVLLSPLSSDTGEAVNLSLPGRVAIRLCQNQGIIFFNTKIFSGHIGCLD